MTVKERISAGETVLADGGDHLLEDFGSTTWKKKKKNNIYLLGAFIFKKPNFDGEFGRGDILEMSFAKKAQKTWSQISLSKLTRSKLKAVPHLTCILSRSERLSDKTRPDLIRVPSLPLASLVYWYRYTYIRWSHKTKRKRFKQISRSK